MMPLVLQLTTIGDDGWRVHEMLNSGQKRQLGQRYDGGIRFCYSCTAMGSLLFVVGGQAKNHKPLALVAVFDSSTREWTSTAPLATARSNHSCTAIGTQLFVVGGNGRNYRPMASAEMYDTNTREWTSMPPLATARYYHSCTVMGSLLFVVGGLDNNCKGVACCALLLSVC